jgi:hypothetical protein
MCFLFVQKSFDFGSRFRFGWLFVTDTHVQIHDRIVRSALKVVITIEN